MNTVNIYFTQEYINFFKELESNNNKEWFHKNKTTYKEHVETPFNLFVGRLLQVFHKLDKSIGVNPSEAVFRINRDLRFSKDKTPYKLFKSALISTKGRKHKEEPGFYLEIDANNIKISGGCFKLTSKQLKQIESNMHLVNPIVNKASFKAYCGQLKKTKNSLTFEKLLSSNLIKSGELDILILTHWQVMLPAVKVFKEILSQENKK